MTTHILPPLVTVLGSALVLLAAAPQGQAVYVAQGEQVESLLIGCEQDGNGVNCRICGPRTGEYGIDYWTGGDRIGGSVGTGGEVDTLPDAFDGVGAIVYYSTECTW